MYDDPGTPKPNPFFGDETGALTILGLFLFLCMLIFTGLAVDVARLSAARTQLQVAADATGHAALYLRDSENAEEAKSGALAVADGIMPSSYYGTVLSEEDIQFGTFDRESGAFTASSTSRDAVFVSTARAAARENGISSYLLQLVGFDTWDVRTGAVVETYRPICFREGFVADGVVDLQSNNMYEQGFCVHSNSYVSLNNNNVFEEGTVVSMPNEGELDMPSSGFEKNPGLDAALRSGSYRLRIVNRLEAIIDGLLAFDSKYLPDYIDTYSVEYITGKDIRQSNLIPGRVHYKYCAGGKQVNIKPGTNFSQVVLVTNCKLKFNMDVVIEDSIITTTHTNSRSMNSASGFRIGRDDGCAPGGDAQLLTMGGVFFAAAMEIYGSQIIAKGDIEFTANADGVEGASLVAGGTISGTSNMSMGFCNGAGMENNFEAEYFRLAM